MRGDLRETGISIVGDVPWGTHFCQFYETKADMIGLLIPYFKKGLENNELCIWITSTEADEQYIKHELSTGIINIEGYYASGQMKIIKFEKYCTKNGSVNMENLINNIIEAAEGSVKEGFDGLRVCGDGTWLSEGRWNKILKCEEILDNIILSYNAIIMCSYPLKGCSATDVADLVRVHQLVLMQRLEGWELIESINAKRTRKKLDKINKLYSVLSKVNHLIIRAKKPQLIYESVCRIGVEEGLFKAAWVGVIDKSDNSIKCAAKWADNECSSELMDNLIEQGINNLHPVYDVINTGNYSICRDVSGKICGNNCYNDAVKKEISACAVFPLIVDKECIGVICFYAADYFFLGEEELELLKSLSEDISFAVNSIEKEIRRKQIEEELRKSEERYRKIVEVSPDAIYAYDDGIIRFSNIMGAKILGYDNPSEVIGMPILDFLHTDYYEMVKERMSMVREKGITVPFVEEKIIQRDGNIVDVEVTATSLPYLERNIALVVARDVTEKKRIEKIKNTAEENIKLLNEAREYDILKTEFFANISHELRTPLNVILSAVQLINIYINDSPMQGNINKISRYMYTVQQNCYRLLRLVGNLIDITKIDSGFFELQQENHNIVSVIEEIALSVAEYSENKGISLVFDTDVEEKIMTFDPDKIERILLNLLSNAVKFTKSGGNVTVNVKDKNTSLQISVKDTGIGIPEDKVDLVFQRFHQVDKSLTRNNEGSGIGLSLVKSLVELHGGTISLISELGKGSEFIIELPIKTLNCNEKQSFSEIQTSNIEKINIEFSDIYSIFNA